MAKIHRLKTWPVSFQDVSSGRKTFEIRKNDRGYATGDFLVLDEWSPDTERYTASKPIVRMVRYVFQGGIFGIEEGYAVLGLDALADRSTESLLIDVAPPRATVLPGTLPDGGNGHE